MHIRTLTFVITVVELLAIHAATGEGAPLKVVVCAGQSNMQGDGNLNELPAYLNHVQHDVLFFDGVSWTPLTPGQTAPSPNKFGPEISFAKKFQSDLGEPIGIIKHSRGATSLAVDWDPDLEGSLYQQLLAMVRAAQLTRPIDIIGMLWMQGEADTSRAEWAEAYAANLEALIVRAREDFGSPKMSFVAGRVNPPGRPELSEIVRKAQEQCPAEHYAWIDCDDLSGATNMHYWTWGYIRMGTKFADALGKLVGTPASMPDNTAVAE